MEVLLAVEGDSLCLDLALLDVDLVAAEDDRDMFANADEITCDDGQPRSTCQKWGGAIGETYGASWGRSCR